MLAVVSTIGLFVLLIVLAGPALVPKSFGSPLVRVTVGIAGAIITAYLVGFTTFVLDLPLACNYLIFPAAVVVGWMRRIQIVELWRSPELKACGWAAGAVMLWLVGWGFCVHVYSGGTWSGDVWEHSQRAQFFIERQPPETKLLNHYSVAARPPLANVIVSVFPQTTESAFVSFQTVMTLLGAVTIWPVWLLQKRFLTNDSPFAPALGACLVMACPTFVQHAVYPWTKLPTVFFVLTGIALLAGKVRTPPHCWVASAALSAAMLTHYSAATWILGLGAAFVWLWRNPDHRIAVKTLAQSGAIAFALFATWLAWSLTSLGVGETFGSNTAITGMPGAEAISRGSMFMQNLWASLVPIELRSLDLGSFVALDPIAQVRDMFFQLYNSNALFGAGSLGLATAIWIWVRTSPPRSPAPGGAFWLLLIVIAGLAGIAVHNGLVEVGLAHISFLPFPMIVIAWLAARVAPHRLPRRVLALGVGIDLTMGIFLHFALQTFIPLRWMYPGFAEFEIAHRLGMMSMFNWRGHQMLDTLILGTLSGSVLWAGLFLGASIILLVKAHRTSATHAC